MVSGGWLRQRLRDATLWPINLVRDFPVRAARIGRTCRLAAAALVNFPLKWVRQIQHRSTGHFVQHWLRRAVFGFHRLLSELFDLCGGPELVQIGLRLGGRSSLLQPHEVDAFAAIVGADGLRFHDVRIVQGGLYRWVFRYNGNLAFATWHTVFMPENGRFTRQNLPILIHELTHVYQYEQVGSRYLGEAIYKLITTRRDCYRYGLANGLEAASAIGMKFSHYNREQQAMIVQDYFMRQQQGEDTTAYQPFIDELRAGCL